ncbi:MAG: helix-turn-helix transcriptional regulator [Deltaproteobacteria bacterium]|jgi:DNA-binding transcriptional ArsR family regulator|nr:helix-turn-helix transcriptional regulator [Deltaproteobacteria bacterium]MBW2521981.1 helix-turn-helix transcriptional regulator [Deltaproteobacteria bacterium]
MKQARETCDCRIIHEEKVAAARRRALDEFTIGELSLTFKALGDVSRLKILWALEHEEMCVCDLAALLGITESAVSHQLRLLRTLRLVKNRRDRTILYYRLADAHVSQLVGIALQHIQEPAAGGQQPEEISR